MQALKVLVFVSCRDSLGLTSFAELPLPLKAFAALNCALKSDMA